jgi:hypothetical protein
LGISGMRDNSLIDLKKYIHFCILQFESVNYLQIVYFLFIFIFILFLF